jgi:aminoglycoside phosphotransferase (APT) family kinase protein
MTESDAATGGHRSALASVGRHLGVELDRSDIDLALARAGLGPAQELQRLTGGNVNSILLVHLADGSRWVLKLSHPVFRPEKLFNEARSLVAFRRLGLPFPALRWAEARGSTLPVDWLIMDYTEGLPMADVIGQDSPEAEALAGAFGSLLARIFDTPRGEAFGAVGEGNRAAPIPWLATADPAAPMGPFDTFNEWLEAEVREQLAGIGDNPQFRGAAEPLAQAILRLGRRCPGLRPGLVHGDFTAANVIVRTPPGGRAEIAAVLDCEWSHYGAQELELLWAEKSLSRTLHPARRDAGLESFRQRLPAWRTAAPELERLATAILQLYEMNAFGWIAADWPPERIERELRTRRDAVRELCGQEAS